jgi:hypothetical protein
MILTALFSLSENRNGAWYGRGNMAFSKQEMIRLLEALRGQSEERRDEGTPLPAVAWVLRSFKA